MTMGRDRLDEDTGMTMGSPEWLAATSRRIVEEAAERLDAICVVAAEHSGIGSVKLPQADMIKVAMYGSEVQSRSFSLGVKLGMDTVLKELRPR
jgi:hypothetical protein